MKLWLTNSVHIHLSIVTNMLNNNGEKSRFIAPQFELNCNQPEAANDLLTNAFYIEIIRV